MKIPRILIQILLGAILFCGCGGDRPGSNRLANFGPDGLAGGGLAIPVSDDFGPDQARQLYERVSSPAFHGAMAKYNCGDPVPDMTFSLALYKRSDFASRRVQVSYSPGLDPGGRQRGLLFGVSYLIEKAAGQVDPTKSWNYTYAKPTGETFQVRGDHVTNEPILDCSKRDSGDEWVTDGPDEQP